MCASRWVEFKGLRGYHERRYKLLSLAHLLDIVDLECLGDAAAEEIRFVSRARHVARSSRN